MPIFHATCPAAATGCPQRRDARWLRATRRGSRRAGPGRGTRCRAARAAHRRARCRRLDQREGVVDQSQRRLERALRVSARSAAVVSMLIRRFGSAAAPAFRRWSASSCGRSSIGIGVEPFDGVGHREVQPLAAQHRSPDSSVWRISSCAKENTTSPSRSSDTSTCACFGVVDDVEQRRSESRSPTCFEQPERERASDDRGGGQRLLRLGAEAFEATADHEPHALGHVEFVDRRGRCGTRRSASKDRPSSTKWRNTSPTKNGLPSVSENTASTIARGGVRPDSASIIVATSATPKRVRWMRSTVCGADHAFEARGQRTRHFELDVAIRADAEDAVVGHELGDVFDQQQRGLVGPVDVVHHHHEREPLGAAGDERGHRVEEVAALLFGRQVERFGDVGKAAAQLRDHARDLGRVVGHVFAHDVGGHERQRLLEHLDERRVRDRALGLVAATEHGERAAPLGVADHLTHERRLADAGLAADEHEAAVAVDGRRDSVAQQPRVAPRGRRTPAAWVPSIRVPTRRPTAATASGSP